MKKLDEKAIQIEMGDLKRISRAFGIELTKDELKRYASKIVYDNNAKFYKECNKNNMHILRECVDVINIGYEGSTTFYKCNTFQRLLEFINETDLANIDYLDIKDIRGRFEGYYIIKYYDSIVYSSISIYTVRWKRWNKRRS